MLTFEEKLAIITTFTELQRRDVSMGRVNFHYEASTVDKKIVVYHLHPNGNGFVYAEHLPHVATDAKGFVNIREFLADDLKSIIMAAIQSLSDDRNTITSPIEPPANAIILEEAWSDADGQILRLVAEDDLWNIYTGDNLEMAFETYTEAKQYLREEGFGRA